MTFFRGFFRGFFNRCFNRFLFSRGFISFPFNRHLFNRCFNRFLFSRCNRGFVSLHLIIPLFGKGDLDVTTEQGVDLVDRLLATSEHVVDQRHTGGLTELCLVDVLALHVVVQDNAQLRVVAAGDVLEELDRLRGCVRGNGGRVDVDTLHRVELFSHDHGWSTITDLLLVLKSAGVGSLILGLDNAVGAQRHEVVENGDIGLGFHQSELSEKGIQANEGSVVTDHHRVDADRTSHVNGLTLVGMGEVNLVVLAVHVLLARWHRLCAEEITLVLVDNSKAILGHTRLQDALGESEVEVGVVEDL